MTFAEVLLAAIVIEVFSVMMFLLVSFLFVRATNGK